MYCRENLVEELSSSFRNYNKIFKAESANNEKRQLEDRMKSGTSYKSNRTNERCETEFDMTAASLRPYQNVKDLRNLVSNIDMKLSQSMGLGMNTDSRLLNDESF